MLWALLSLNPAICKTIAAIGLPQRVPEHSPFEAQGKHECLCHVASLRQLWEHGEEAAEGFAAVAVVVFFFAS